ncbi:MAG: ABC transporter ATP-binding protein [Chloroflexi bacterium]|nr:ABC transporter ATP-binding protein [Chloroflexota bacterium]
MTRAFALHDVSFRYPRAARPALERVSLAADVGEFIVLAGRSGCGKSTLLRCLNGLIPHLATGEFAGRVEVFGRAIDEVPPHRLAGEVGFVFQNPEDQLVATVVESDVAFGPENLGLPPEAIRARVDAALRQVGIEVLRERSVHELSAGQQQKVALAASLAMRPALLLLDEPTSQLDPASAEDFLHLVARLRAEAQLTVVLAEHRLDLALPYADRLVAMADGQIVVDDPPAVALRGGRLGELGIGLPPVAALALALERRGWQFGRLPLSVDELVGRARMDGATRRREREGDGARRDRARGEA